MMFLKVTPMKLMHVAVSAGIMAIAATAAPAQNAPLQLQPKKPPVTSPARPLPAQPSAIDQAIAVSAANDYLNSASMMTADFVQTGPDGQRSEGKLYVHKPGRLRFEFTNPATLEIIADGVTVAIRDLKRHTQDPYFIGQTPLKFLLKENIDLSRDTKILTVSSEGKYVAITIEDKTIGSGTSRIKLSFDASTSALKHWKVVDPQGYETQVSLSNIETGKRPDPELFRINQENFRTSNTNK